MLRRLESILTVVLSFSLFFGTFPMYRSEGAYKFSWLVCLYSVVLGVAACVCNAVWLHSNYQASFAATFLPEAIAVCFNASIWAVALIQYYLQRDTFSGIISQLNEIHGRIGINAYGRRYVFEPFLMTALNAFPSVMYLVQEPYDISNWAMLIITFFFLNIPVMVACQYAVLMNLLSEQLSFITTQLRLYRFNLEVSNLLEVHYELCTLAARINNAFNVFLFQLLIYPLVLTVIKVYVTIVCIVKPEVFQDEDVKLLTAIVDALINIGIVVLVVAAAAGSKNNSEEFNLQLSNYILMNKTTENKDFLKNYFMMKYSIKQTACGFFTLDYPLLTSMATGVISYVIILVQFTLIG